MILDITDEGFNLSTCKLAVVSKCLIENCVIDAIDAFSCTQEIGFNSFYLVNTRMIRLLKIRVAN